MPKKSKSSKSKGQKRYKKPEGMGRLHAGNMPHRLAELNAGGGGAVPINPMGRYARPMGMGMFSKGSVENRVLRAGLATSLAAAPIPGGRLASVLVASDPLGIF